MSFYILGLLVSLLAGLWFIIKAPEKKSWIYLFLAAGGAYLMTVIFTHILPELFTEIPQYAGYALLAGFLIQILLENYSRGIEHGHAHALKNNKALIISFVALCIHATIEGMPMAAIFFDSPSAFYDQLMIGIMLHKIPVAITLAMIMNKSNLSKKTSIALLVTFIGCTVLGSGLQYAIGDYTGHEAVEWMFVSLGLTIGILLHVSTTILFESSDHHRLSPSRIVMIVLGIGLGLIS